MNAPPGPDGYLTLGGRGEADMRVRGSRFNGFACSVASETEARMVLEERARSHYDASHHCAAWRLRDGSWRALDAGEPSGSAGAPILAALEAAELYDAAVVVTRYFGGTKLGIGGLVRAYGEAAALAIADAPKWLGIPAVRAAIYYPYEHTSVVMRALDQWATSEVEHGYAEAGGSAMTRFVIPAARVGDVDAFLQEQSAGSLRLEIDAETVLFRSVGR